MTTRGSVSRLAVLIDSENISSTMADGLFREIAEIGSTMVRRIYGDFSNPQSNGWISVLGRHGLVPQQQFPGPTGKNSTDILMVIDTMDLLHSARFDAFCLVTSDSDFTRLATRIREQGLDVYGFGTQKSPERFRLACSKFTYVENLHHDAPANNAKTKKAPLRPAQEAVPIIKAVFVQMGTPDGWVALSDVVAKLAVHKTDFDPRTYGFATLSELVRRQNAFIVSQPQGGGERMKIRGKKSKPVVADVVDQEAGTSLTEP